MNYSEFLDEEEPEYLSKQHSRKVSQKPTKFDTLRTILKILHIFHNKYDKKLNLEKLFNTLAIPSQEREKYLTLILEFQELFRTTFHSHSLTIKEINSTRYLVCKKFKKPPQYDVKNTHHPGDIKISSEDLSSLNDIVYMFTNVRRGKGFDLKQDSSEIVKAIKTLRKNHPYLFFSNGHGYVYPTEFGVKLGEKTNTYLKSNRPFDTLEIEDCTIIIE
ncbi:MAG: hypothetical protein EU548_08710 [Promethearchaeota archaeon]|nr:MAG: hypothetical protein EU548_08710 [Candidatus Lokiarchaeota archaeon]